MLNGLISVHYGLYLLLKLLLLLLLRCHYCPVWTFTSLMDFSPSALLFYLSFQYVILHLLICVCTQFTICFLCYLLLTKLEIGMVVIYVKETQSQVHTH